MDKDAELLDKVILFLVFLVGVILIFTQFQFYRISLSPWVYLSIILIAGLIALIVWHFLEQKPSHHSFFEQKHYEASPWTFAEKLHIGIIALVALLILFNQMQLSQASALAGLKSPLVLKTTSSKTSLALTGDPSKDAIVVVIPRGVPFYGEALGVSFDDPIKSLEIIAQMDPSYGRNKVQLSGQDVQKYIGILTTPSMGCQYCCGADTAVTQEGRPTCGCKHSWAMRGLAAYLIKNYPDLSDEEIMREISKWKGLFFPKQMVAKYIQESQSGQYSPDIASLLLDVDEEKIKELKAAVASSGSASSDNAVANIDSLPSMVGGC